MKKLKIACSLFPDMIGLVETNDLLYLELKASIILF